jgi:hypothetical protein
LAHVVIEVSGFVRRRPTVVGTANVSLIGVQLNSYNLSLTGNTKLYVTLKKTIAYYSFFYSAGDS